METKSIYEQILQAENDTTVEEIVDKEKSKQIRVHMPCKVVAVNGNKVDVEIQGSEDTGLGYFSTFPILLDLPIIYNNYTSKAYIITPIQIGDTGLVEFLDFNSTNFNKDGNTALTSDRYYHSLNNGTFINGFIPDNNIIDISGKNTDLTSKKNNPTMLVEPNDEIWDRPIIENEDGTYSTACSATIGIDFNGKEALAVIPTVYDGAHHTLEEATQRFVKTHKHFGIFDASNPEAVEKYSVEVHNSQAEYNFNSDLAIIMGTKNSTFKLTVDSTGELRIESKNGITISSGLGIDFDTPEAKFKGSVSCGNGVSGTFQVGGKNISVIDGIITSIV